MESRSAPTLLASVLGRHDAPRRRRPQQVRKPLANPSCRRKLDDDLDLASVDLSADDAGALEQRQGPAVVAQDGRVEPTHALIPCAIRQAVRQRTAQAATLPIIGDGDRDLGKLRIVGEANVAGDAQQVPLDGSIATIASRSLWSTSAK